MGRGCISADGCCMNIWTRRTVVNSTCVQPSMKSGPATRRVLRDCLHFSFKEVCTNSGNIVSFVSNHITLYLCTFVMDVHHACLLNVCFNYWMYVSCWFDLTPDEYPVRVAEYFHSDQINLVPNTSIKWKGLSFAHYKIHTHSLLARNSDSVI